MLYLKMVTTSNFISKDKRTELAVNLIEGKKSTYNIYYDILNNQNITYLKQQMIFKN